MKSRDFVVLLSAGGHVGLITLAVSAHYLALEHLPVQMGSVSGVLDPSECTGRSPPL